MPDLHWEGGITHPVSQWLFGSQSASQPGWLMASQTQRQPQTPPAHDSNASTGSAGGLGMPGYVWLPGVGDLEPQIPILDQLL